MQVEDTPIEVKEEMDEDVKEEEMKQICDSEMLLFLRSLKLDEYHDVLVSNGADKLGQLIYVDDTTIDLLCTASGMKIIHAGVFKRAIRECKVNARMSMAAEHLDRAQNSNKYDSSLNAQQFPMTACVDQTAQGGWRQKYIYSGDERTPVANTSTSQPTLLQLYAAAQAANEIDGGVSGGVSTRVMSQYANPESIQPRQITDLNMDDKRVSGVDSVANYSGKSSLGDHYSPTNLLADGSYYVTIYDRSVKFPASIKKLTIIDRIDQERRDVVRRGSQIYGRDDTKRKHNELTQLEIFMNEIAFEICLRDFTYMISRQKLLGLVREIIKDNQIQLSGHHSYPNNPTFTMYVVNGKNKDKLKAVTMPDHMIDNSLLQPTEDNETADYEIILYHKLNKEWPPGLSKDRRKYLGRRSSNFELIDNILFYSKDNKRRRWIHEDFELSDAFERYHVDADSGSHYTREATVDRVIQKFYCKNMNEKMTKIYLGCIPCRAKFNVTSNASQYPIRSNRASSTNEDIRTVSALEPDMIGDDPAYVPYQSNRSKRRACDSASNLIASQPPKKPRKSIPQRLATLEASEPMNTPNQNSNLNPTPTPNPDEPAASLIVEDNKESQSEPPATNNMEQYTSTPIPKTNEPIN